MTPPQYPPPARNPLSWSHIKSFGSSWGLCLSVGPLGGLGTGRGGPGRPGVGPGPGQVPPPDGHEGPQWSGDEDSGRGRSDLTGDSSAPGGHPPAGKQAGRAGRQARSRAAMGPVSGVHLSEEEAPTETLSCRESGPSAVCSAAAWPCEGRPGPGSVLSGGPQRRRGPWRALGPREDSHRRDGADTRGILSESCKPHCRGMRPRPPGDGTRAPDAARA